MIINDFLYEIRQMLGDDFNLFATPKFEHRFWDGYD